MKLRKNSLITDFSVGLAVTAGVFALGMYRGYSVLRCFCDGFFVAAVLLLGVGGIVFARNKGSFDLAGYGLSSVFFTIFPSLRRRDKETPIEYIERKRDTRKPATELLISGAVYLVLTLLALTAYELL